MYRRCCSQCGKRLSDDEILIGTDSASRPAVCSSCYDSSFAEKCGRCWKPLTFDRKNKFNLKKKKNLFFILHRKYFET